MTTLSLDSIWYPSHIKWVKQLSGSELTSFSKSQQQKISHLAQHAALHAITFDIQPLTEESAIWFQSVYNEHLAHKHNPIPRNILETTVHNEASRYRYDILTLSCGDQVLGATIFTQRKDRISIVYRSYPQNWPDSVKSRCSPALYAEYLITDFARQCDLNTIVHGQDKNLYGVHSAIGVAQFKLAVGCLPTQSDKVTIEEINLKTVATDTLIFQQPDTGTGIKTAILYAHDSHPYEQLLNNSSITVEFIQRTTQRGMVHRYP